MCDQRHFLCGQMQRFQIPQRIRSIFPWRIRAENNLFRTVIPDDAAALLRRKELRNIFRIEINRRPDEIGLDIVPFCPAAEMRRDQIASLDMGYTGSRAKPFEPDFVRMCLGRKIH